MVYDSCTNSSGVLIIYFFIRRSAADEMDQKKWNSKIVVAIVSWIGAVIASATLNLISRYSSKDINVSSNRALALGGLYLLFNDTVFPTLIQRIKEMF